MDQSTPAAERPTGKQILVTGGAGFIGSHLVDAVQVALRYEPTNTDGKQDTEGPDQSDEPNDEVQGEENTSQVQD